MSTIIGDVDKEYKRGMKKKKAATAYLHKPLRAYYCQRCNVSLPGSGWVWVGPLRFGHDYFSYLFVVP